MKKKKEIRGGKEEEQVNVMLIRSKKELINQLKEKSIEHKISLNSYINFVLNSVIKKKEPLNKEIINKIEKREIESRVYFTLSEANLLRRYAEINKWSMSREIRYRVISSISKKPKLSKEELKAIYAVRSSINLLGANINRLVRDSQFLSDDNIGICKELIVLMKELKDKIGYLEKCSYSNFKLKEE